MTIKKIYKVFDTPIVSIKEFKKKYCGQFLGSGAHRKVYIFKPDDRFVVKIQKSMKKGDFANVTEWRNYINNREWEEFEVWLAPCEAISDNGQVLLQWRVERETDGAKIKYPSKIPSLLTDTKKFNFGLLHGKFVCCDYSFLVSCDFKMKKAKWW